MKAVKLFEEWVGDTKVPNPLAESICKTLDKYGIFWRNMSSKKQKAQGGVTINISYEEGLKFILSDYFSKEVLKRMKPRERDLVEMVRSLGAIPENSSSLVLRAGGKPKYGVTFIIYARGAVRLWLEYFQKVSSNDNVDIAADDPADVQQGTFKFLTRTLIFNLEGVIVNRVAANLSQSDLLNLGDSSLKNERLFHSITYLIKIKGVPDSVFKRMIRLNRHSIDRLTRLAEVAPTRELLNEVVSSVNMEKAGMRELQTFAKAVLANPKCDTWLIEVISDFVKEDDLIIALSTMDLPSVDLKKLYFKDSIPPRVKEAIRSNPNFGDIVGDEGGILSDWF
jgi:hypothetical protein